MWWLVMKTGRKADLLLTPRALLNLGRQASDANSSTSSENTAATGREPPRSAVDAAGSRTVWIRPHLDMKVKPLPISFFFFPRSMVSEQKGEKAIGLRLWTCDKNKHVRADTFQTTVTVGSKRTKQTVKTFIRTKLSELYSCYAVPQLIKLSRLFIKQQEVHIKYSIILHFLARFPRCRSSRPKKQSRPAVSTLWKTVYFEISQRHRLNDPCRHTDIADKSWTSKHQAACVEEYIC